MRVYQVISTFIIAIATAKAGFIDMLDNEYIKHGGVDPHGPEVAPPLVNIGFQWQDGEIMRYIPPWEPCHRVVQLDPIYGYAPLVTYLESVVFSTRDLEDKWSFRLYGDGECTQKIFEKDFTGWFLVRAPVLSWSVQRDYDDILEREGIHGQQG